MTFQCRTKPKLPSQIDLYTQIIQFADRGANLIDVACIAERLLQNRLCLARIARHDGLGLIEQLRHRVAAQFQAWIVEHSRQQAIRRRWVDSHQPLIGQPSTPRRMMPVDQKLFERGGRQRAALEQAGGKRSLRPLLAANWPPMGWRRPSATKMTGSCAASASASFCQAACAARWPAPFVPTCLIEDRTAESSWSLVAAGKPETPTNTTTSHAKMFFQAIGNTSFPLTSHQVP